MAQFGNRMFPGRAVPGLLGGAPAERPGVYGNPGQFQPMPAAPRPDLPAYGRGNEIPGMGQPAGGVSGFTPGMQGIGTGIMPPSGGVGGFTPGMGQPGLGGGSPAFQPQGGPAPERPGVYGNPGQHQPMPPQPRPDLPAYGRGNEIAGMGQPQPGGGIGGYSPGIGTGVGAPNAGSPNMAFGGGSIGGYSSGPGGMSRPMALPTPERPGVYGNPGQYQPTQRPRPAPPIGGRAPMRSF